MSSFTYLTVDGIVSTRPCKLLSVILSQEASGTGEVRLYDERSAEGSRLFATLLLNGDGSCQFRWEGLELQRGLYVDIYNKVDYVTVEWEPLVLPKREKTVYEHIIESAS